MTNNINSTSKLTGFSEYLNKINSQLAANELTESERVDLIPILERMLGNIQIEGQTLGLDSRITVLEGNSKDQSQVEGNQLSIEAVKDVWRGVYNTCIKSQLSSLIKQFTKIKSDLINNPNQSPDKKSEQCDELKKIAHQLKLLNLNPNLKEKGSVKIFLDTVIKLLFSTQKQIEKDCADAPIVSEPFVPYSEDPSALNIGEFTDCSNDILEHLLSFLSAEDLARFSRSSKFFYDMCNNDFFWEKLLQKEFPSNIYNDDFVLKRRFQKQFPSISFIMPNNKSAKEVYISEQAISNLKNGLYTCSTLLKGNRVVRCMLQDGNLIFSGDRTHIKIWDVTTNQYVAQLQAQATKSLHKNGNLLVSGSHDGTIKMWNLTDLKNIQCIADLKCEGDEVACILKAENLIFSGCDNDAIEIRDITDLNNIQCITSLRGHENSVICLYKEGNLLFSGSRDKTIKVWDLTDLTNIRCIATLRGHKNSIRCLEIKNNHLFSGSSDGMIRVFDLTDLTNIHCIAILEGHDNTISSLQIKDNLLFSGSWDNTIKIWNLTTNQCICTLKDHNNSVISLYIDGNRLISGSIGGSIEVWDLNASPEDALLNLADMIKDVPLAKPNSLEIFKPLAKPNSLEIFKNHIKNLPPVILNEIYGALYEIQTFQNDYFGCAKHAFLGEHKLNCTVGKRVEAIHRYLLKGVVKSFKKGNSKKALDLFKKLPKEIKNAVYEEFYKNNKFENEYYGCAERVFLNESRQKIADDKKIEAIERFLESTKVKR